MSGSKGSFFLPLTDFFCCFIQAFTTWTILALKSLTFFTETPFNVVICKINNLRRIPTFSLVQEFTSHNGSFDQLQSLMCLPTACWHPDILSSLCLGFLLGKTQQISQKAVSERNEGQITIKTHQSFPWLAGRGKSISPPAALSCEGCDTKASGLSSLDVKPCPAPPELPEFSFPRLGGRVRESTTTLLGCIGVSSPIEGEMCRGRDLLWADLKAKALSEEEGVKLVANLTSSGAASISSVNFAAVIPEANKLQW